MHVLGVLTPGAYVRSTGHIGATLAACIFAAPAAATQHSPSWSAKVQLLVEASDPTLTTRVSSWVTEELRHMQGVEVVDSAADWRIYILVLQTQNQAGMVTGYALSEVVSARFEPSQVLRTFAQNKSVPPENRRVLDAAATITELTSGVLWSFEDHRLKAGPLDGLRRETEDLAAAFDTRQLEPSRKLRSEEHTSELQSRSDVVCRLLLERRKTRSHPRPSLCRPGA